MLKIEMLEVAHKPVQGIAIEAPGGEGHPNMLVLQCKKGYIMWGYLNMDTAVAVGDAAAIVGGADFAALLCNPVKAVSPEAAALGVEVGMTGAQACEKLNG